MSWSLKRVLESLRSFREVSEEPLRSLWGASEESLRSLKGVLEEFWRSLRGVSEELWCWRSYRGFRSLGRVSGCFQLKITASRCIWALQPASHVGKKAAPSWPAAFRCIWQLLVLTKTCFRGASKETPRSLTGVLEESRSSLRGVLMESWWSLRYLIKIRDVSDLWIRILNALS